MLPAKIMWPQKSLFLLTGLVSRTALCCWPWVRAVPIWKSWARAAGDTAHSGRSLARLSGSSSTDILMQKSCQENTKWGKPLQITVGVSSVIIKKEKLKSKWISVPITLCTKEYVYIQERMLPFTNFCMHGQSTDFDISYWGLERDTVTCTLPRLHIAREARENDVWSLCSFRFLF